MQSTLIREADILFNDVNLKFDLDKKPIKWEMLIFSMLLLLANISLFQGSPAGHLAYNTEAVEHGQWWRIFTFPFVHVSWYHLLLDGSAFLFLYHGLEEEMRSRRILCVVSAMAGGLILPLLFSPIIDNTGLTGLSGCAHGLMAITGLEMIRRYPKGDILKNTGYMVFAVVVIKSLIEAFRGEVIFFGLHLSDVGTPVVEAHLGGIIGGILVYFLLLFSRR